MEVGEFYFFLKTCVCILELDTPFRNTKRPGVVKFRVDYDERIEGFLAQSNERRTEAGKPVY